MVLQYYEINTPKVSSRIRIALITDLHSCYYGEQQQELITAIDAQSPDLILMAGDIFDDRMPIANAEQFLSGIIRYPCYYVTGNHEYRDGVGSFHIKMSMLNKYGITVLSNRCETVSVNGTMLNLCGVDDPTSYMIKHNRKLDPQEYQNAKNEQLTTFYQQLDQVNSQAQNGYYTVLLSHRPELYKKYVARGFDLVLCGHAHGGQWRIPGVLNGLYAPQQGLFPPYAGGKYEKDGTSMIVSRGLARESTFIPRIFNPPELVVITINEKISRSK